ncbi:MAG: SDR family NAD(P)-dependent oxidoreductase, partial [Deltaproteobacteria bacterium]
MPLNDVALVTGASTGIGRATVRALTKKGYRVFATARREESVRELQLEGRDAGFEAIILDVEQDDSVDHAVRHVLAEAGSIDVLVNNAGFGVLAPVEAVTPEVLRQQFETNVIGAHRMVRAVLPSMRARGRGTIVQLSSVVG